MKKQREEKKELTHEPAAGYKTVFYIVLSIAALYLAVILLKTI